MDIFPNARRWYWTATWTITAAWLTVAAQASDGVDPAAGSPLFEYAARYEVERNGRLLGELAVRLERRDDGLWHYEARSENPAWFVRLLGLETVETSWFDWRDGRVLPLTYHHVSGEPGSDRYWQHRYDWETGRSETTTHRGALDIPIVEGVLDPMTLRVAAQAALAGGLREDLQFLVLERDEVETQAYRFEGSEQLVVDGRCHDTLRFERFRREGSSRNYTAWHSRRLGWVPVRIRHDDDGDAITMTLSQWESDAMPIGSRRPCGEGAGNDS